MNKDLKERWVAALRSGKYKQGKGQLRDNIDGEYHYCCLGVLCEVAGLEINRRGDEVGNKGYKPLKDIDPSFGALGTLAEMNDNGYSFKKIADYIEENIPAE